MPKEGDPDCRIFLQELDNVDWDYLIELDYEFKRSAQYSKFSEIMKSRGLKPMEMSLRKRVEAIELFLEESSTNDWIEG